MIWLPTRSALTATPCPYTTLFRAVSGLRPGEVVGLADRAAELDALVDGMAGIEGRGRNTAVRRELQHLAVDPRMIGGDIPAEALVLAAGAGFQRPGLLRIQRHETGAAEAALHQVAEIQIGRAHV